MTQNSESLRIALERIATEARTRTRTLDLSNLQLSELPVQLSCLEHLQKLDCSRTQVEDLSPLSKLTKLQVLYCFETQVKDLSPLTGLTALQELDCSVTTVSKLSPLSELTTLQKLNCSATQVEDLLPLAELTALQELDCSATPVSNLSPLSKLTALQKLYCSRTQVKDLPLLSELTALQELDCSATQVNDLSPLGGLAALQRLHCSGTQVEDLLPLAGLTALEKLDCSATPVSNLSPLSELIALQELDCSSTQVKDLPLLAGLIALQELDCSGTPVDDLSPLKGLTALQRLYCARTQVENLSPLSKLTTLQVLGCSGTQVRKLSPLAGLTALQRLYCSRTQVKNLSPLSKLTNLQLLHCFETQVNDLSPLAGLTALQELNCSATQVSDLSSLARLIALKRLHCNKCRLLDFPKELLDITTLELYLHETRIPDVPSEVLSKYDRDNCSNSFRAHLHALKSGGIEITDTKVLILGNGRIGKTQICRRLRGEAYDENVSSTHGIIVSSAMLSQEDGQPMRLHLWDFGGQDIYHSTHALFMRTRAVFLLVWIPQAQKTAEYKQGSMIFRNQPLSYWLAYIRYLSGLDNPVLIVQTRCDRPEDEKRNLPLPAKALKGFLYCKPLQYSSLKNRGRVCLDEALRDSAVWLREQQGKILIGRGWMRVRQRLKAMRDADVALPSEQRKYRTLSQEHFRQICMEGNGDVDLSDSKYLLEYLHNTGIVFYRQGLFRDEIILDQGWALEAIYTVFHREKCYQHLRNSKGRFDRSLLEAFVWQDYFVEEQKLFLSMMQSCGICFIHKKGDERLGIEHEYIAPDLLPDKAEAALELEEKWEPDIPVEEATFEYELHQPGLLRSFISEIGGEAGLNALYWKNGICFYEKTTGSRALIEQKTRDGWHGVISIQTQKGKAAALLTQLTERLTNEQKRWGVRPKKSSSTLRSHQLKLESGKTPLAEPESPKLKFIQEPSGKTEYCVSYAWGDDTEEGKEREAIVDWLCKEADQRGIKVLLDKRDLGLGDDLLRFMKRVAHGGRVFVVLSDKYLKSFNCVFELTEIWHLSQCDADKFAYRTRPYALPEVKIFEMGTPEKYRDYWDKKVAELTPTAHSMAPEIFEKFHRMKSFVQELPVILAIFASRKMARTFDELRQYGFSD